MNDATENSGCLLVLNTCPGSITAKKIANELVACRLAACVQIIPGIQSFFRWTNKVDNAEEYLLLIKTTSERYQELEDKIKSLHPYELPEIVAVPIHTGLAGYLSWIGNCTDPT
ncbi:MAG: divalent-cation tolerance protein CutA [bacterium]